MTQLLHAIEHGDGIDAMLVAPAASAALVLTDPPWGATRAKWDRPLEWEAWWSAIDRVLVPEGVLAVFANLRLALDLVPLARRRFAYDLVWRKNRKTGHLNASKAPMRQHELILVFGDQASEAYHPQRTGGHAPMHAATRRSKSELYGRETVTTTKKGDTTRLDGSVLDFDSVSNDSPIRIHSNQKPIALLRWLVRAYSKPGDLVLDPTCGSGAVIHAARAEGRSAIGYEADSDAADRAKRWLEGRDLPLFAEIGT